MLLIFELSSQRKQRIDLDQNASGEGVELRRQPDLRLRGDVIEVLGNTVKVL